MSSVVREAATVMAVDGSREVGLRANSENRLATAPILAGRDGVVSPAGDGCPFRKFAWNHLSERGSSRVQTFRANAGDHMCDKCAKLDAKIEHYRKLASGHFRPADGGEGGRPDRVDRGS
jgi:hypothetical protein